MALNKQKPGSNMYGFINCTINFIKGICPHQCKYCYAKQVQEQAGEIHLDYKELKTNMKSGNTIFVGSSTDMWADQVPKDDIIKALYWCDLFSDNTYFFQSKNPKRFFDHFDFPARSILCTTLESNRDYPEISKAPKIKERAGFMEVASVKIGVPVMVTIEPLLDFDVKEFLTILNDINPAQINIGADSKGFNLPEPSWHKVQELINGLQEFKFKIYQKSNLDRLKK